ncbi:MAG: hypothetical protein EOR84_20380 [Mesorhizobium sp.]|uniref:hypothetical protein n=1 Tax=Mesorhizobium sp. TaxID=1871066 RepID=UPI000FE5D546|nr:hypothetical protein [Mesorhizobium sp.]RWM91588.1 MAG: hypothetical protein EOR84_20380 [Mesorhizobium sp.]
MEPVSFPRGYPGELGKANDYNPASVDLPALIECRADVPTGMTFSTRIALNVTTVDSHPGKVLAGCSSALDAN